MSAIARLYNAFDPYKPLPAGDPAYVNCEEVRGDRNVELDLGRKILRQDRLTYQLYSGHRGAGIRNCCACRNTYKTKAAGWYILLPMKMISTQKIWNTQTF